jgi:serpin B
VADTDLAVAFYRTVASSAGAGSNLVVSPYSVSSVLKMLDVGAAGETARQIQSVLHLPDSAASIAPAYAALACENQTDGTSQDNRLSIANAIWAQKGKSFESAFLGALSGGYAAPLQQVDFEGDPGGASATINDWVSSQTQAAIPSLLQPGDVDRTTQLVLVDAVYFKGAWAMKFDPRQTSPRPFTLSDGSQVQVPTMGAVVGVGTAYLNQNAGFVYELPYEGGSLAMDFVLPQGPLSSLESTLTPDLLNAGLASLTRPFPNYLTIPKFSFYGRLNLRALLIAMGLADAFDPAKADLSGMDGKRDLYVGATVEEALVQVDEQGTVAAAATAANVPPPPVAPEQLDIDHPFLFLIRDTRSGSILFVGRVEDPRQGM